MHLSKFFTLYTGLFLKNIKKFVKNEKKNSPSPKTYPPKKIFLFLNLINVPTFMTQHKVQMKQVSFPHIQSLAITYIVPISESNIHSQASHTTPQLKLSTLYVLVQPTKNTSPSTYNIAPILSIQCKSLTPLNVQVLIP